MGIKEYGQAASEVELQDNPGPIKNQEGEAVIEITNDQDVGIGTATPAEKLDVEVSGANGGIRVKNTTDNAYVKVSAPADEAALIDFQTGDSTDWQLTRAPNSNDLAIYDNDGGSGYMVTFEQGGNVGVGTTDPAEKVDVALTGANGGLRVKNATDNAYVKIDAPSDEAAYIDFQTADSTDWQLTRAPNSNNLAIYDNDGAADYVVTFEQGGNVGVGTSDPAEKLDVSLTGSNGGLRIKNATDNAYVKIDAPADEAAYVDFQTGESTDWQLTRAPNTNNLAIYDNDGASDYVVTFEQGGDVGIGTGTPRRKLDILDASNPQLRLSSADDSKYVEMKSISGGSFDGSAIMEMVGTNPSCLFLRSTDAQTFLQVQNTNAKDISGNFVDSDQNGLTLGLNTTDAYIFNRHASGKMYIGVANTTAITIDSDRSSTFVSNLAANGSVTLGDATADAHVVNGTLRLASEYSSGPSAPADGAGGILYVKDDGKLYFISEDVSETDLTSGGGGGGDLTIVTTSSATYALSSYNTMVIVDSSSNAVEVDLPTASGNAGKTVDILAKTGTTNAVTIDPNGSETINGVSTSYILNVNYANLTLVSDGSNWVIR